MKSYYRISTFPSHNVCGDTPQITWPLRMRWRFPCTIWRPFEWDNFPAKECSIGGEIKKGRIKKDVVYVTRIWMTSYLGGGGWGRLKKEGWKDGRCICWIIHLRWRLRRKSRRVCERPETNAGVSYRRRNRPAPRNLVVAVFPSIDRQWKRF